MTYVVTDNCIKCKFTDCVNVCPTDAFREGPNFLVIHPDWCIDCSLCVPECAAEAIFRDDQLTAEQQPFLALNAELAVTWKPITDSKDAPPDAADWNGVPDKLVHLER